MAKGAPKGNKFWEIRSKHGRDKIFATPKIMWDAAVEYFKWCDENPLMETVPKVVASGNNQGSEVEMIEVPHMRPYTIHGLCLYLHVNTSYFNQFAIELKDKKDKVSKEFSMVISNIRETIYNQQFSGAAAEFLNPNIIARNLGIKDGMEVDSKNITTIKVIRE